MACSISKRQFGFWAAAALALASSSCGPKVSSISGKVTVGGKPVTAGQISFVAKTGVPNTFKIKPDGSYLATGVPTGEMIVLVFGPPPPKTEPAPRSGMAKKMAAAKPQAAPRAPDGPAVPAKYGDVSSSDLRYTVTAGANTYNAELN